MVVIVHGSFIHVPDDPSLSSLRYPSLLPWGHCQFVLCFHVSGLILLTSLFCSLDLHIDIDPSSSFLICKTVILSNQHLHLKVLRYPKTAHVNWNNSAWMYHTVNSITLTPLPSQKIQSPLFCPLFSFPHTASKALQHFNPLNPTSKYFCTCPFSCLSFLSLTQHRHYYDLGHCHFFLVLIF